MDSDLAPLPVLDPLQSTDRPDLEVPGHLENMYREDWEVRDVKVDPVVLAVSENLKNTDRPDLEVPGHPENTYREDWELQDVKVDPVVLAVSDHLKNTDLANSENDDLALDRVGTV